MALSKCAFFCFSNYVSERRKEAANTRARRCVSEAANTRTQRFFSGILGVRERFLFFLFLGFFEWKKTVCFRTRRTTERFFSGASAFQRSSCPKETTERFFSEQHLWILQQNNGCSSWTPPEEPFAASSLLLLSYLRSEEKTAEQHYSRTAEQQNSITAEQHLFCSVLVSSFERFLWFVPIRNEPFLFSEFFSTTMVRFFSWNKRTKNEEAQNKTVCFRSTERQKRTIRKTLY